MSRPLVSVVVPTFNRAAMLREALDTVRRQTYADWELIVVDDGSTDGTREMLSAMIEPRLRTIRLEHSGNPAIVRNAGLAVARGEYVAFLDDDDLWGPDKLAVQVPGLRQSGCRWSYTAFRRVDEMGMDLVTPGLQHWHPRRGWILEHLLRIEAVVPLPTVLVERAWLHESGGFDEALIHCEDYDLWFRLAARGAVHVEEQPLACVRVHPSHYQADREAVHRHWIIVYAKAAASMTTGRLAALCRRQRAGHQTILAALLASRGERRAGAGLLIRSFLLTPSVLAWCKAAARVVLPASVIHALRPVRPRP